MSTETTTDPQTSIKTQINDFLTNFQTAINSSDATANLYAPAYVNDTNLSVKANNILKLYYIILNGGNVNGTKITGFLDLKSSVYDVLGLPADKTSITKNYIDSAKNTLN